MGADATDTGATEGNRHALIVGITTFDPSASDDDEDPEYSNLSFSRTRTSQLSNALTDLGYSCTQPEDPELESDDLGRKIRDTIAHADENAVVIVHVLSHGCIGDRSGSVYVVGSDGRHGPSTQVEQWLSYVEDFPGPQVLFLLDICHAGAAARLPWQLNNADSRNRSWVIGAASAHEAAFDGRFTQAVADVLRSIADGEIDIDRSLRHVPLPTVAKAIDRRVLELRDESEAMHQEVTCTAVDIKHARDLDLPFFPNPNYRRDIAQEIKRGLDPAIGVFIDELDEVLDAEHFLSRASGRSAIDGVVSTGMFHGRARQLHQLSDWIDDTNSNGLRVITGSPGVGKSALLGVLLCAAHPVLREPTHYLWSRAPRTPSVQSRLAAIHARQRSLNEILLSIARQLSLGDEPSGGWTCADLIDAVRRLTHPPLLLLDALDEAVQASATQTVLLLPLVNARRDDGRGVVRLMVGMRPWEEFAPLHRAAAACDGLLDLDDITRDELRTDLRHYANDVLRTHPRYHSVDRRDIRETLAAALADRLTDHRREGHRPEWGEFLVAGLFLHYLLTARQPATHVDEARALGACAPCTLPEVLELDLARTRVRSLRAVLVTLAFARGDGLPESLVVCAAGAFMATTSVTTTEIRAGLAAARFYIRHTVETDGTTLYRLFHQGLADHLRDASMHSVLFQRLVAAVPRDGQTALWRSAEPYLLRHIARHAADAGLVDELSTDAEFLVHADPTTLVLELDHARTSPGRVAAAVYRRSVGRHAQLSPQKRREILVVDAARYGVEELAAQLAGIPSNPVVSMFPRWCTGSQTASSLRSTLAGHTRPVAAVYCTSLNGRSVVVTASLDRTLRVWDLTTGHPIGAPLTGHTGPVTSLAGIMRGTTPVVVSGSRDCTVRTWDLSTGEPLGEPLMGHQESVNAVACCEFGGRTVIVAGGEQGVILWDLHTRQQLAEFSDLSWTNAVVCQLVAGHMILMTGGDDNVVRQWDLSRDSTFGNAVTTGEPKQHPSAMRYVENSISALCAITKNDSRVIAVGKADGTLRLWDMETQRPISDEIQAHQEVINCLHHTELDGRSVIMSGGDDGVRVWMEPSLDNCGIELTGHDEWVWSVATTKLGRRQVAISGSGDTRARVWDIADLERLGNPIPGPAEFVQVVDICRIGDREVAVSSGNDRVVRLWDLATGEAFRAPLAGHTDRVFGLACAELNGHPVAVTASMDGTAKVWHLVDGTQVHTVDTGQTGRLNTVACTRMADHLVAVITGFNGTIGFWDITTQRALHQPLATSSRTWHGAVSCTQVRGRTVAVTGGGDRVVQIWDIADGRPSGPPITGHSDGVRAITCAEIGGQPVAIAGDAAGMIRIWDLDTQTQHGAPIAAHRGRVTSVRCVDFDGHLAIVAGGTDGITIWDAHNGQELQRFALPTSPGGLAVARNGDLVMGLGWEVLTIAGLATDPAQGRAANYAPSNNGT